MDFLCVCDSLTIHSHFHFQSVIHSVSLCVAINDIFQSIYFFPKAIMTIKVSKKEEEKKRLLLFFPWPSEMKEMYIIGCDVFS